MSSDKDDGNVAFLFFQPGLQLQTRHLWHADINDQASSLTMQIGFEEVLRAPEASCREPRCLHEVAQRILHRIIIINDCNQLGLCVPRHFLSVACLSNCAQSNFGREKPDLSKDGPYFRWIVDLTRGGIQKGHIDLSLSAIRTNSGKDLACIFF